MATITIELPDERIQRMRGPAAVLGITPEELARRTVQELADRQDEDFDRIVDDLLEKNRELLRRLA